MSQRELGDDQLAELTTGADMQNRDSENIGRGCQSGHGGHGGHVGNGGHGGRRKRHATADPETLRFRRLAHEALDPFWNRATYDYRAKRRRGCYAWLRRHLRLPESECHISRFSIEQCKAVIELCRQANAGVLEGPREHHGNVPKRLKRIRHDYHLRRREMQSGADGQVG